MINCVSNLAWKAEEKNEAINILKKYKIKYLEFAPNLLLKNRNFSECKKVKMKWMQEKLILYSMQSILFNINDAYIFGTKRQFNIFYKSILKIIKLAKKLGVKIIIFGSPLSRKTFGKNKKLLDNTFIKTFKNLSLHCKKNDVTICIEPNPKIYKSEYLNNMSETVKVVKKIKKQNIKINFDLGACIANRESLKSVFLKNINLIGHCQISVPRLKNLNKYKKKINFFKKVLKKSKYNGVISMEVLAQRKKNIKNLEKNIKILND